MILSLGPGHHCKTRKKLSFKVILNQGSNPSLNIISDEIVKTNLNRARMQVFSITSLATAFSICYIGCDEGPCVE